MHSDGDGDTSNRARRSQDVVERFAVDPFHHQVECAVVPLPEIERLGDIGMTNERRQRCFFEKHRLELLTVFVGGQDGFDGDHLLKTRRVPLWRAAQTCPMPPLAIGMSSW